MKSAQRSRIIARLIGALLAEVLRGFVGNFTAGTTS